MIIGEGRYEPTNFSSFLIHEDQLVWDWDAQSSNYTELRAAEFEKAGGRAWQIEAGEPIGTYEFESSLLNLAQYDPKGSGYGDGTVEAATKEAQEDLDVLFGTVARESAWVTHLYGEIARDALGDDLTVGADDDQSPVSRFFQTVKSVGTPPACPTFDDVDCGGGDWTEGGSGKGCSVSDEGASSSGLVAGFGALAAMLMVSRRRRRS